MTLWREPCPWGIVGIIPTKVSGGRLGSIRHGDLLVTAGTLGHAMKGNGEGAGWRHPHRKALEEFAGPGRGVIEVWSNVK